MPSFAPSTRGLGTWGSALHKMIWLFVTATILRGGWGMLRSTRWPAIWPTQSCGGAPGGSRAPHGLGRRAYPEEDAPRTRLWQALAMGVIQGFALLPGVSPWWRPHGHAHHPGGGLAKLRKMKVHARSLMAHGRYRGRGGGLPLRARSQARFSDLPPLARSWASVVWGALALA
jgi:hypothetical protein